MTGRDPLEPQPESDRPAYFDLPHAVAFGNPFDGITLFGTFPCLEAAIAYGEENSDDREWSAVPIETP